MKTIKRNCSLNFPIKLNYKSNDLIYSYRGGKSTTNLKLINVNKNKYFEENKSFLSYDKKYKNESYISNSKTINNKNQKNYNVSYLINNYNNNIPISSYFDNYLNNKPKSFTNNNSNIHMNNNNINNSYNLTKYYLNDKSIISNNNSKYNISNTIADINSYNNNNNYIFPYIRIKNDDKNLFNKRQIYKKPKNEGSLSSYSFALTDCNSIGKENINLNTKSNINIHTETNNNNYIYSNPNKSKKYILIPQRYTYIPNLNTIKEKNIKIYFNNCKYKNINNQSFLPERRTNIDYSNLNLYSPKVNKDNIIKSNISYMKKSRSRIKSDIIKNNINDTINYFSENHYKTTNDHNIDSSYIYVRKNSSKKNNLNKRNINNNKIKKKKKIKVNLRSNTIIENAYYVQKNVILIQKNYRMHLACLKKCILKALKNIVEGTNKLYYLFYKNIAKKLFYILNNAYIKSIDINMKTSKIIPKHNNKKIFIENCKNNIIKPKYFFLINNPERFKKLSNNRNKNIKFTNSPKLRIKAKPKCLNENLIKIKKDIELIRALKNQIITKLDMFKK